MRKLWGIGILLGSFALAGLVIRYQPHIEHMIRSIGGLAFLFALLVFTAVAAAPFSMTDALAIMNGSIFGPLWGSVINGVGIIFAAALAYWINARAQHLLDLDRALERLPGWVKRYRVGSAPFLIAVRMVPGFGGTVATATAAALRVGYFRQIWTMSLVAIPICVLLAVFGHGVTTVIHHAEARAHRYILRHRPHFHFHIYRLRLRPRPTAPAPRASKSP